MSSVPYHFVPYNTFPVLLRTVRPPRCSNVFNEESLLAHNPEPLRDPKTGLCQVCDWDESGELLFKLDAANTEQKFQGYFGNAKATTSKILRDVKTKGDAYFRSGDLIKTDKEGRFYFVDRIGDTFRWKAENVSTAEVADVLGKHEDIEEANVYGVQVPHHDGRAGCAAIILKSGSSATSVTAPSPATLHSIAEHVQKNLPGFAAPIVEGPDNAPLIFSYEKGRTRAVG